MRWVFDEAIGKVERKQRDGNIDEEDPAPVEVIGNPAAQGRPDGGRYHDGEAVECEGVSALLGREGIGENGLLGWGQAAAARAL